MIWVFAVIAVLGAALLAWVVLLYNGLVTLQQRVRNAWSQIDVQLKRRHDLIPNLVETAKGYLAHERETFEAVAKARADAEDARMAVAGGGGRDPGAIVAVMAAENVLTGSLGRLLGRVEAYPQLKGDAVMSRLMEELTSTENRIAFARQSYNDGVMRYETGRQSFPTVLLAGPLGFGEMKLFEIQTSAEREPVRVAMA